MARLMTGLNDLATVNPDLAAEWHPTKNAPLLPSQVTGGSSKKVWWLGKCGHEWEAVISKDQAVETDVLFVENRAQKLTRSFANPSIR